MPRFISKCREVEQSYYDFSRQDERDFRLITV